jgi:hypothetical protein
MSESKSTMETNLIQFAPGPYGYAPVNASKLALLSLAFDGGG